MSLFQCEVCGCCENTALAAQGCRGYAEKFFDWTGIEDRKGKLLCSEHAPNKYKDGVPTDFGKWHGRFKQRYYPIGMFKTGKGGNLEHVMLGEVKLSDYEILKDGE